MDERASEVLDFWFGRPDDPDHGTMREEWFRGGAAFDQRIRSRFNELHREAVEGGLEGWQEDEGSCLALVIMLDQFSRNLYRENPEAFASDPLARKVADGAISRGFDRLVSPVRRVFYYLPFEHSEILADQQRCVELVRSIGHFDGYDETLDFANRHLRVIERFGRFPHRNAVLGRTSTAEEIAFLEDNPKGF